MSFVNTLGKNPVAPARERGLKYDVSAKNSIFRLVAPARERGLKFGLIMLVYTIPNVAPARERGLKLLLIIISYLMLLVAPARERGLKLKYSIHQRRFVDGRSREGAWIEIFRDRYYISAGVGRSREGAWIEIACGEYGDNTYRSLPRGSVD